MDKSERENLQDGIARITQLLKKTKTGSQEQKILLKQLKQFMNGDIPTAKKK
ncbi:MAG: hypothetical protein WCE46_06270 [Methanoregula sp.]|uniref:hypothetical protein n=1 Tax=Methanoregula sp. TaxID=2052170 RepID=UPI003C72D2D5